MRYDCCDATCQADAPDRGSGDAAGWSASVVAALADVLPGTITAADMERELRGEGNGGDGGGEVGGGSGGGGDGGIGDDGGGGGGGGATTTAMMAEAAKVAAAAVTAVATVATAKEATGRRGFVTSMTWATAEMSAWLR